MSDIRIKEQLRQWVLKKQNNAIPVDYNTALLKERVINSVHLMDLILLIEHLSQAPLEVNKIKPQSFTSIDTIYATFFEKSMGETA